MEMAAKNAGGFASAGGLQSQWLKRPLRELRRRTAVLRCAAAAPFSAERRTRLAWLRESPRWRTAGIPVLDVVKALFHVEETGSFYIPIQKAGCTSMTTAIRQGTDAGSKGAVATESPCWRNPLHLGCVPEDFRSGARRAFTVVRHPVDRFWSAYNHLVVQGGDDRIGFVVRESLRLSPQRPLTPDLLLDYVGSQPIDDLYFAFRPQFAISGVEMLPIRFARLENLVDDLGQLLAEGFLPRDFLGRVSKLNVRNSVEVHERYRSLDRRVAAVYGRDMAVFGYS
jgi:hypothetical protein